MVINPELQDLYATLSAVLDGYNKTHDAQVVFVEFEADASSDCYRGTLICREYEQNLINYHYRDLIDSDFDWFTPEQMQYVDREVARIIDDQRRQSQRAYREGRDASKLWFNRHKNDAAEAAYHPVW